MSDIINIKLSTCVLCLDIDVQFHSLQTEHVKIHFFVIICTDYW